MSKEIENINENGIPEIVKKIEGVATDALYHVHLKMNDKETRELYSKTIADYCTVAKQMGDIDDFLIVCDETNNTAKILDSNNFRADIYIKLAKTFLLQVDHNKGVDMVVVGGNHER